MYDRDKRNRRQREWRRKKGLVKDSAGGGRAGRPRRRSDERPPEDISRQQVEMFREKLAPVMDRINQQL